jgi:hypothetical protein
MDSHTCQRHSSVNSSFRRTTRGRERMLTGHTGVFELVPKDVMADERALLMRVALEGWALADLADRLAVTIVTSESVVIEEVSVDGDSLSVAGVLQRTTSSGTKRTPNPRPSSSSARTPIPTRPTTCPAVGESAPAVCRPAPDAVRLAPRPRGVGGHTVSALPEPVDDQVPRAPVAGPTRRPGPGADDPSARRTTAAADRATGRDGTSLSSSTNCVGTRFKRRTAEAGPSDCQK